MFVSVVLVSMAYVYEVCAHWLVHVFVPLCECRPEEDTLCTAVTFRRRASLGRVATEPGARLTAASLSCDCASFLFLFFYEYRDLNWILRFS